MPDRARKRPAKAPTRPLSVADEDAGRDAETGQFLPGNRFWEARSSAGPKPKFDGPDPLWAAVLEYFGWVAANPLYEDNLVTFQGAASHEPLAKMRAMTIDGLCNFLDIDVTTWHAWRKSREDLAGVISRAESLIRQQKFEGASAGLLAHNIIARDLGLSDKGEMNHTGSITFKTVYESAGAWRAPSTFFGCAVTSARCMKPG